MECLWPPLPNSRVEILTLTVTAFGNGICGRCLGLEGASAHPVNGISAFMPEAPESPSTLPPHEHTVGKCHLFVSEPESKSSPDTESARDLISDIQALEL